MKKLNHPCKNSCSGWNDGFKEGEYSVLQQHESMSGKLEIAIDVLELAESDLLEKVCVCDCDNSWLIKVLRTNIEKLKGENKTS